MFYFLFLIFFSVYVTFQYLPFNRFHSKCMIQVTANNFFQYIYNVKVNPMFVVFFFFILPFFDCCVIDL